MNLQFMTVQVYFMDGQKKTHVLRFQATKKNVEIN